MNLGVYLHVLVVYDALRFYAGQAEVLYRRILEDKTVHAAGTGTSLHYKAWRESTMDFSVILSATQGSGCENVNQERNTVILHTLEMLAALACRSLPRTVTSGMRHDGRVCHHKAQHQACAGSNTSSYFFT